MDTRPGSGAPAEQAQSTPEAAGQAPVAVQRSRPQPMALLYSTAVRLPARRGCTTGRASAGLVCQRGLAAPQFGCVGVPDGGGNVGPTRPRRRLLNSTAERGEII